MKLNFFCKHFSELTATELHEILKLRINVFIVEQNCPYHEIDGKDLDAFHVFGINSANEIVAVCRILKPSVSYEEASIGRVATAKNERQTGAGIELMEFSIRSMKELMHNSAIRISAQEYLKSFYEKFGFKKVSDSYLEDDIPHIEMLRMATA